MCACQLQGAAMSKSGQDITLGALIAIFGIRTTQAEPYWGWLIIPILLILVIQVIASYTDIK